MSKRSNLIYGNDYRYHLGYFDDINLHRMEAIETPDDLAKKIREAELSRNYEACLEVFDKAISLFPWSLPYRIQKARYLVFSYRLDEAFEILEKIVERFPSSVDAISVLGLTFFYRGNLNKSVEVFDKALDVEPFVAEARMFRAKALKLMDILHTLCDPKTESWVVLRLINEGLKIDPANREIRKVLLFRRGEVNFDTKRYPAAIKDLTDAMKFDTKNADAFMLRAKSFVLVSQFEDAIIDLMEVERMGKTGRFYAEIECLRKRIGKAFVPKNNYKLLEVSRNATREEIVCSFKSLSMLYQVDLEKTETDAEKRKVKFLFKRIEYAYAILSDRTLKQKYDRYLKEQDESFKCSIM